VRMKCGRYAGADSILRQHFPTHIYHNEKYTRNAILTSYYLEIEQWDSCMYYANLVLSGDGSPYSQMFGHADMAKSYLGLNRPDLALPHMKIYHRMLDSLRREENQALSLRVEAAYDYSLRERDNIELQAAADRLFADAACGHVLRVKGFAPDLDGQTGWLELNATAAGKTLAPIPQGQDVLIVIGEGLDKAAIEARLKA